MTNGEVATIGRLEAGGPSSIPQALLSCRRILNGVNGLPNHATRREGRLHEAGEASVRSQRKVGAFEQQAGNPSGMSDRKSSRDETAGRAPDEHGACSS